MILIAYIYVFIPARILEDRVTIFSNHLHSLQQQRDMVSSHETTVDMSGLNSLQEDLHWIILVVGEFIESFTHSKSNALKMHESIKIKKFWSV